MQDIDIGILRIITTLIESIAMYICIHIGFGRRVKLNFKVLIFSFIYVLLFDFGRNTETGALFNILFIIILCKKMFKISMLQTVFRFILSVIVLGASQIISLVLYQTIIGAFGEQMKDYAYIFVEGLNVVIVSCISIFVIKNENKQFELKKNIYIYACLFTVIVFLIYMKVFFQEEKIIPLFLYVMCFCAIILTGIGIIREQNAKHELEKKKLELNINRLYGEAYKDLLNEVRRKQHDYDNQLSAIYSSHVVASNLEELIAIQKEYMNDISDGNRYHCVLTKCKNQILAGYIYNKCILYEKSDIEIDVDILTYSKEYGIPTYELIEVLGIMLNNAYEYIVHESQFSKQIKLIVKEKNNKIEMEVLNQGKYLTCQEIGKMFELGYSTKGSDRGMGLYSLKKIASKYGTEIMVDNVSENGVNWIRFKIAFK